MNSENKHISDDYKTDIITTISKFAENFDATNKKDIDMLCDIIELLKENNEEDARVWEPINIIVKTLGIDPIKLPTEHEHSGNKLQCADKCEDSPNKKCECHDDNVKPIEHTGEVVVYKNENVVQVDKENNSFVVPQVRAKYAEAWVTPDEFKHFKWEDALKGRYRNGMDHYTPLDVKLGVSISPFNYRQISDPTKAIISYRLLCPQSREFNFMIFDN